MLLILNPSTLPNAGRFAGCEQYIAITTRCTGRVLQSDVILKLSIP